MTTIRITLKKLMKWAVGLAMTVGGAVDRRRMM